MMARMIWDKRFHLHLGTLFIGFTLVIVGVITMAVVGPGIIAWALVGLGGAAVALGCVSILNIWEEHRRGMR